MPKCEGVFRNSSKNLQLDGWKTTFLFGVSALLFSWDMLALGFQMFVPQILEIRSIFSVELGTKTVPFTQKMGNLIGGGHVSFLKTSGCD